MICDTRLLHTVTYENGLRMQEVLVEMRQKEQVPDQLLLLQHPPVFTLGRAGKAENLLASSSQLRAEGIRFYDTTRGGDITYHGPGQIVGYPILHLGEGSRDIRKYVERLEEVLIRAAAEFGVNAERNPVNRGVWVGRNKLAAIGVRIGRWVTSHGFAFNVSTNLRHYDLITPCGLQGWGVTSLQKLAGSSVTVEQVVPAILRHFSEVFDREIVVRTQDLAVAKVVIHDGDRVLLLHRHTAAGDFWQPVTGVVEPGETPSQTARRELREETGHDAVVTDMKLVQSYYISPEYFADRRGRFADEHSFAARVDSRLPVTIDQEEHDAYQWFTLSEAYERIRWTNDRQTLELLERLLASRGAATQS